MCCSQQKISHKTSSYDTTNARVESRQEPKVTLEKQIEAGALKTQRTENEERSLMRQNRVDTDCKKTVFYGTIRTTFRSLERNQQPRCVTEKSHRQIH